ncbi:MAG TPA: DUF1254 domain-containing protein [Candidatus Acidoferrum sp.]|nr:DUF1254 domain-containing protein [Candidatus Acidoferrum sp.]
MLSEKSVNLNRIIVAASVLVVTTLLIMPCAQAQKYKMETPIPAGITTPDKVETRLGTLKFEGGYPDAATVEKVYDNLDFQRGIEAYLNTMQGASLVAFRRGMREVGAVDGTFGVFNTLMDSKSLFLTANTDTVYAFTWIDLSKGPVVIESPPNSLGIMNDFWFRYVADLGNAGPDKGKGGKYLFLPPGYKGDVPQGYFVFKCRTFGNWFATRGFLVNGDPGPAVESFHKTMRTYPLSEAANPHPPKFVNLSGKAFNTIGANDYSFYEDTNALVQEEPADSESPELMGQLLAIGIEKGKPFAPDERMKKILTDSVAVGNATARAIEFRSRNNANLYYPGKAWFIPTGFYLFLDNDARMLDARTMFFYAYTGVTPAMVLKMVGVGSQYAIAALDSENNYLDGGKSYKLNIPANPPAKNFWSVIVYDTQTRSMLQTDQQFPTKGSHSAGIEKNADGSYDLYFGPKASAGKESNWIQTVPGRGWFTILRLYGPLEPWFNKTWKPGEFELQK